MRRRTALIVLLLAAVAAVLVLRWRPHGLALVMRAEYPPRVRAGQVVVLRLFIGNPHARPVRLEDVDLDAALAGGLTLVSVTPPPRRVAAHRRLGVLSLSYDEELPGHTLQEWIMRLKAVKTGVVAGEVAVYSATNVRSQRVQITVLP